MKSWNKTTNKDCFDLGNPTTIDHIWPISLGGSNAKINKMTLSKLANEQKANKTKGKINSIRFSIVRAVDKEGNIYGRMQIKKADTWEWVEPTLD